MKVSVKRCFLLVAVVLFVVVVWVQVGMAGSGEGVFGSAKKNPFVLTGTVYYIPEGTSRLPDFSKLKPVGKIYTTVLNITPRRFDRGFPGVTRRFEWFAIDYKGKIYIPKGKAYTFSLLSDDGSKLIIDRRLVIDNDGVHPPREKRGRVYLKKGIHEIEVSYFQGPRWEVALVLSVIEGGRKKLFNMKDFALVEVEETGKVTNLIMSSAVLFDFDSYRLKPEAEATLDTVVEFLKGCNYARIVVEGHTDDIGSQAYNLKLSRKRAEAVANYLVKSGIPRSKIKTVGYGESRPRYPNTSEENRRKNRRVEIKIIKE